MAVVINEFEVLPEAAPSQPAREEAREEAASAAYGKPEPSDLAPVLARLAARALRVWAH